MTRSTNELLGRIELQRKVLAVVNRRIYSNEPLSGLTGDAIDRWSDQTDIQNQKLVVDLLRQISARLFLLSNKSQEQITEDYKNIQSSIEIELKQLQTLLN